MVALYAVWYNWTSIHKMLRVTPAMAAKLAKQLWSMQDIVKAMDADAPVAKKRGPYNKTAEISN